MCIRDRIISAAITIPFMYFASYKPTQQMFVKKPKIDRALSVSYTHLRLAADFRKGMEMILI